MSRSCPYSPTPFRIVEGKYMDPRKLVKMLRKEYGQSNFRVEVTAICSMSDIRKMLINTQQLRLDQYKIYIPDHQREQTSISIDVSVVCVFFF
ncbi:uncharacterized protein P174DRAFT_437723 [Aspergillus novofumigatus IBT 16806]|uniref:Uncharacterized protein n=1 Tax=Aspergillus novofumigatus (strain IBT 16806) TaxID=1392255 RepID=A0A2I1CNU0_ASPN1|nr:uncharacterized protein P174DRAFT_437723 [Aspergillus novofumigatus IBT 16806]PKX99289.1 hypothetical protein P174DRAFT_437723 [Aspergillus novofumigatus IBT 16806]